MAKYAGEDKKKKGMTQSAAQSQTEPLPGPRDGAQRKAARAQRKREKDLLLRKTFLAPIQATQPVPPLPLPPPPAPLPPLLPVADLSGLAAAHANCELVGHLLRITLMLPAVPPASEGKSLLAGVPRLPAGAQQWMVFAHVSCNGQAAQQFHCAVPAPTTSNPGTLVRCLSIERSACTLQFQVMRDGTLEPRLTPEPRAAAIVLLVAAIE